MTAHQYVLGIDGGTEGIRVGIFTLDGTPVIFAAEPYTTNFPQPGWAEQDPRDWWNALGIAMRRALAESGINKNDIVGLAADTTCCSVVALDAGMQPLRDAIIWMDVRAEAEAEAVLATGDPALGSIMVARGRSPQNGCCQRAYGVIAISPISGTVRRSFANIRIT